MYKYHFLISCFFIFLNPYISNVCDLIFGIGTDIAEVNRIARELVKNKGLKERIFTDSEIEYCESKRYPEQHFAGRFAAKEAFFKATGTGWGSGYAFSQIEIIPNETGKPIIQLMEKSKEFVELNQISNIHVSISHLKEYALATVILEQL
jgi:holo-[acyl-carrier protein] synthase